MGIGEQRQERCSHCGTTDSDKKYWVNCRSYLVTGQVRTYYWCSICMLEKRRKYAQTHSGARAIAANKGNAEYYARHRDQIIERRRLAKNARNKKNVL